MPRFKTIDLDLVFNHPDFPVKSNVKDTPVWHKSTEDKAFCLPAGRMTSQGIPFSLSSEGSRKSRFIALGRGSKKIQIPLRGRATYLCLLHFCDSVSPGRKTASIGDQVAEYVLELSDGTLFTQPIRKRFEIDSFGQGRQTYSYKALPHISLDPAEPADGLSFGKWETGVTAHQDQDHFLGTVYALPNPKPDVPLSSLSLVWKGSISVGILGLTLFDGPGHPQRLERRNLFKISLPAAEKVKVRNVESTVDLGFITGVKSAPKIKDRKWTERDDPGLGVPQDDEPTSELLIEAAAARGAVLTVKPEKGKSRMFDLDPVFSTGRSRSRDGSCRIKILHPSKTWVHAKVIDDSTGLPTPTRINFSGSSGEYLPPYGHHSDVNTNWFEDYAGEVKLGDTNFAYVPGEFQIELPPGKVYVEISKGFEYTPTRACIEVAPGQRELELHIGRPIDLRKDGWVTADTHVHFISPETAWLEGQGEGVNLVNLLASQWGKMFTNVADITGAASGCSREDTIVWVGTENRHHMLGHISMLGAKGNPVFPMCAGGPSESYFGDPEFCLLAEWAQRCRKQRGATIRPHFPGPLGEDPTYIILDLLDGAEMRTCGHPMTGPLSSPSLAEWYRYLNCGYRVAACGGTDKMSAGTPVGGSRTYARLKKDELFTFGSWTRAVRAGRTFVSSGPLLDLTVEGRETGEDIRLPASGGTLQVRGEAHSVWPVHTLEIIANGRVVDSTHSRKGVRRLSIRCAVPVRESCWIAARCVSRLEKQQVMMGQGYLGAHTSPVYVTCGNTDIFNPSDAVYMLTLLEGTVAYLDTLGTRLSPTRHNEMIGHVHKAEKLLKKRLDTHGHSSVHDHTH